MPEPYSVFIGDVALDEYYKADYWPTIQDKALVDALPATPGGMIANAACVSAALGMNVKFMAALNSGAITQFLLDDLNKSGVDTSLVVFDDNLADSKNMIFLVGNEHTVLIPRLGLEQIELTRNQLDTLARSQYIYSTPAEIATLHCGVMDSEDIIDHCRKNGVKLVFDVDVDYTRDGSEERYKRLDILFFNEAGFDRYRGSLSQRTAVDRLLGYGLELVIVTLAENGCVVYSQSESITSPAFNVDIMDVTGAGDTFCSSFVFALSLGKGIKYAAEFANAAASICVSRLGARAGAVSRQEIERIIRL